MLTESERGTRSSIRSYCVWFCLFIFGLGPKKGPGPKKSDDSVLTSKPPDRLLVLSQPQMTHFAPLFFCMLISDVSNNMILIKHNYKKIKNISGQICEKMKQCHRCTILASTLHCDYTFLSWQQRCFTSLALPCLMEVDLLLWIDQFQHFLPLYCWRKAFQKYGDNLNFFSL